MSFEAPLPPYNFTDPTATFFSASCIDLLLIELVPLVQRMAESAPSLDYPIPTSYPNKLNETENLPSTPTTPGPNTNSTTATAASTTTTTTTTTATTATAAEPPTDEDTAREDLFNRLESLGYKVGIGLVERFSRDRSRFTDNLDVIKFLCKDIWHLVFRKQIDNLKTNHRGVYVLTDQYFRPLLRMSSSSGVPAATKAAPFLQFPCGVIRGALSAMGVNAQVSAETPGLPGAVFQITTVNKTPSS
ncbi:Trafficking protein particle complex subunit 33 [Orbilia oligospora]|uniref:Trafficking protein particle complex subunit 33 n=1 Tax=Orbilia oligospora TaxID=2813651 RepID=A0A6G1M9J2_ORBOL|nr:Trafficking protein particle complex subunit 33 [Orbilia oligospora]KAF3203453.1 Trafficking protein particle complex subunit 33 [Orbilia oligospora]KAF3216121.1 Trafficking protein particle complex subunit 33 [Orbilia oligospora]KAF3229339.1 Trafficking protein particle complex subunit 33 [Orbilia oligospora]KAF3248847.1 Trafficking protein particle complex subunit 33 [Orbilia oligospora]